MTKFLLDTHVFIWMDISPTKLTPSVAALLTDRSNTLLLSVVSVWEMQIKLQLGKLQLEQSLTDMVNVQQQTNHIQILPVTLPHVLALQDLPMHHKDPFDRLLTAQVMVENATLVSSDDILTKYPVNVLW